MRCMSVMSDRKSRKVDTAMRLPARKVNEVRDGECHVVKIITDHIMIVSFYR